MIIDYISSHQAEFWMVMGFALLAAEVLTGFTVGAFLFSGIGALITGGLMSFGILEQSWVAGISSTGISAGVVTALLWKPLKNLQGDLPVKKDNSSDLIGHSFVLEREITRAKPGLTNYSGVSWRVELDKEAGVDVIAAGKQVTVSSVEVGVFKVKLS